MSIMERQRFLLLKSQPLLLTLKGLLERQPNLRIILVGTARPSPDFIDSLASQANLGGVTRGSRV